MERILKLKIRIEKGYGYVLNRDGYVLKMKIYGPEQYGRPEKILKLDIQQEKGYVYIIDKNGYVCRSRLKI